jgi:4-amino-4-deoxy-L-arabinose transferase-like glycosyltransferase
VSTAERVGGPAHPMRWVVLICVLAFVARMGATAMFEGLGAPPNAGAMYDGVEYEALASSVVRAHEYAVVPGRPTSFRAPGFPLALAAIYAAFGDQNYVAAHVFFCLVGAALCLATYLVGRETGGEWTGVVAAAFVAVYPNLLYYSMHFASEPLFTLLLTTAVWLALRALRTGRPQPWFWSGIALGLATLVRPVAFYFFPFVALAVLWVERRTLSAALASMAVMVGGLVIPIAPWTLRNYVVHDRYVLVASNGGSTFWGANNQLVLDDPALRGDWVSTERMAREKAVVRQIENEIDRDSAEWAYGKAFVREHLADLPRLAMYKVYALWTPASRTPNALFNLALALSYGAALPFMVAGIVLLGRRRGWMRSALLMLAAPVVATTAATVIFYGSARFRSTIEPLLLVFAAYAIVVLVARVARVRPRDVSELSATAG